MNNDFLVSLSIAHINHWLGALIVQPVNTAERAFRTKHFCGINCTDRTDIKTVFSPERNRLNGGGLRFRYERAVFMKRVCLNTT
jgi:hypothetical protein